MTGVYPTKFCMIWDVTARVLLFPVTSSGGDLKTVALPLPRCPVALDVDMIANPLAATRNMATAQTQQGVMRKIQHSVLFRPVLTSQYMRHRRLTFALLWKESSSKHSFLRSASKSLETLGGSSLAILKCPPVSLESISSTSKFLDGACSPISHVACLLLSLEETGSALNH